MNTALQKQCERFVQNGETLRQVFHWDSSTMALAGSTVYTGLGRQADAEMLKRCEKTLLDHSGFFSELRGNLKIPLLCKMSAAPDPERYFSDVEAVDQEMNKSKWLGNSYMLLASMVICDHVAAEDAKVYVEKTNEIFGRMKDSHRWLTSDEDIPFAALLSVSGTDVDRLIAEGDRCYPILRDTFGAGSGNAVQTLSHILALCEKSAEEKCAKAADIYARLKQEKHKIGIGQELAILGLLAMLDIDAEILVREVIEADEYLKTQNGFGDWDTGSSVRRMYAAMIVATLYKQGDAEGRSAMVSDTLAISVAIEVCIAMMMILLF